MAAWQVLQAFDPTYPDGGAAGGGWPCATATTSGNGSSSAAAIAERTIKSNDTASNPAVPDFREILRWFSPNLPPNRNFASGRPKKHFLLAGLQVDAPYWEWRRKAV